MTPEQEKRKNRWGWWDWFGLIVFISFMTFLIASRCRADTTKVWQEIEKPKPRVCHYVCFICGDCWPVLSTIQRDIGGMHTYVCSKKSALFDIDDCDGVIVWGRYRTICRVDTIDGNKWLDSVSRSSGFRPDINVYPTYDTIYTDDPRCLGDSITPYRPLSHDLVGRILRRKDTIPVIPSRGLDSTFNVKEKIWYYYNWSNGKRVNMRAKP